MSFLKRLQSTLFTDANNVQYILKFFFMVCLEGTITGFFNINDFFILSNIDTRMIRFLYFFINGNLTVIATSVIGSAVNKTVRHNFNFYQGPGFKSLCFNSFQVLWQLNYLLKVITREQIKKCRCVQNGLSIVPRYFF